MLTIMYDKRATEEEGKTMMKVYANGLSKAPIFVPERVVYGNFEKFCTYVEGLFPYDINQKQRETLELTLRNGLQELEKEMDRRARLGLSCDDYYYGTIGNG